MKPLRGQAKPSAFSSIVSPHPPLTRTWRRVRRNNASPGPHRLRQRGFSERVRRRGCTRRSELRRPGDNAGSPIPIRHATHSFGHGRRGSRPRPSTPLRADVIRPPTGAPRSPRASRDHAAAVRQRWLVRNSAQQRTSRRRATATIAGFLRVVPPAVSRAYTDRAHGL